MFLILLFISLCLGIVQSKVTCSNFETCGKCISFGDEKCVWCSQPTMKERRCQSAKSLNSTKWCDIKYKIDRKFPEVINVTDDDLRSGINAIQFKPQHLHIKALPGDTVEFNMSYKPAKDFPLDVYYLMDLSFTMRKYTQELKQQGRFLYNTLTNFTNNVKFGIGTFVEKNALPYADPLLNYAYSFKHRLSMTEDIEKFTDTLSSIKTGSNYDDPESGLDALMQVMACDSTLGWRPEARRIIVLCTDGTYHSAGDGKMVGAIVPNDMKCHLDTHGSYEKELIYDYPSVSQINKMAREGKFLIIFAATKNVQSEYIALSEAIEGSKYAELKDSSSNKEKSNIIEIIQNAYLNSIRYLVINKFWPPNIQIHFSPDCTEYGNCEIKHNKVFDLKGILKVKTCPESRLLTFEVGTLELKDKLTIELEVDCECECEKHGNGEENSTKCSSVGTYQCGICKCNDGRYGDKCHCSGNSDDLKDLYKCRAHETDAHYCSGRGTCKCGKCGNCTVGYSGEFCEFDDNACLRVNNKLCAGKGICTLGRCECDPSWTGDDCNCPDNDFDCIAPYSKQICSGNGKCVCGECICNMQEKKEEPYGGTFCDRCDECAEKKCKEFEDYVHCNYMNNKTFCDQLFNVTDVDVFIVNKTEINSEKYHIGEWCRKQLDDGTAILFKHFYRKSTKKLHLIIQKELDVPPKANILVAVASSIGAILLIGLLTLLVWKILMDIHDKKEYEKFASEAKEAGFHVSENPWYCPPEQNFSNPIYDQ